MGVEPFDFMNFENEISEWEFTETDFSDEDLKSLESKVDVYLAKIKELDPSLHEDPQRYQLIDQQVKDFVSIERLHRSTAHNRHIFFAGIPLSHSVQLLSSLKELQAEREKAEKLEEKARKLSEEIDELNEEKRVDFYRFERSIQRAVSMGVGVNRLVSLVENRDKIAKRQFITKLRNVNYTHLCLKLRKLDSYKAFRFVNLVSRPIKARFSSVFRGLKQHRSSKPLNDSINIDGVEYPNNSKLLNTICALNNDNRLNNGVPKPGMNPVNDFREAQMGNELDSSDLSPMASHRDDAEVERGLLMRLESLIEQEMKMLV